MIYEVHSSTRETPAEYEYSAPTNCINCGDLYDADDHAHLLTEIGFDANRQMQHICDECLPGFTCEICREHRLDLLRICDDLICPTCIAEMFVEVA